MNEHRTQPAEHHRAGLLLGLLAYGLWGVLPIYFKLIEILGATDIVAHRVIWSVPFLGLLITMSGTWPKVRETLRQGRVVALLFLTALLIAANWLLYVHAVTSGHILAASFGYYLNPLANVLLGRFVLNERLSKRQWIAVALAAAGISVLAAGALSQLWISLTLCATFALYGLVRKVVAADPVTGLAIETGILLPVASIWLARQHFLGVPVMGTNEMLTILLLLAGIFSTTPLLLFTAAAKRLQYSTLGMLQFAAPTLQFLIAVLLYGERFTIAYAIAFLAIWIALGLFVTAMLKAPRLPEPPE